MRCSKGKLAVVTFLIFSFTYSQVVPSIAGNGRNKVRAAFVGIRFEDLPPEVQKRVLDRVQRTLSEESALELIKPDQVRSAVGEEKVAAFLARPDSASYRQMAEQLQVDHLFAGDLANRSRDPDRVLLVGELNRFDLATGLVHRFEVVKYYENLGIELVKFQQEFVRTIVPVVGAKKTLWPWLVLAGVGVAGLIAMALTTSDSGTEGVPPTGTPDTP